jgi:hypothetical protein
VARIPGCSMGAILNTSLFGANLDNFMGHSGQKDTIFVPLHPSIHSSFNLSEMSLPSFPKISRTYDILKPVYVINIARKDNDQQNDN